MNDCPEYSCKLSNFTCFSTLELLEHCYSCGDEGTICTECRSPYNLNQDKLSCTSICNGCKLFINFIIIKKLVPIKIEFVWKIQLKIVKNAQKTLIFVQNARMAIIFH